ncbi:MAG: hypothetical protein IJJ56_10470 [Prevotella sp.]|nr:hypothetical protein [Prevotella sp.]MBR0165822.1 hypothetical protein [Prevotella sp.]
MLKYSDHLKAVLYPENICEVGENVEKRLCQTVQHFSYKCQRSRNDTGFPYGGTTPTELQFTVRLESPNGSDLFYQQMQCNELFDHTLIFNATYDQYDRLKVYDDAMIVRGYVVDVMEDYDATVTDDGTVQQILVKVTLLLSSITYIGNEEKGNRQLKITHY